MSRRDTFNQDLRVTLTTFRLFYLQFTNAQNIFVRRLENQADPRGLNVHREETEHASAGMSWPEFRVFLSKRNSPINSNSNSTLSPIPQITPNPNLLTSLFSSLQFNQNSIFNPMLDMGSTRALVLLVSALAGVEHDTRLQLT